MLSENFEFHFKDAPIIFKENLSKKSSLIHKEALTRAQRYLAAEADLLEIIIEIDKVRLYEEFGLTHLTPYCVKHLGLSEDVAANFVRVARKAQIVPELKVAIDEGRLSVTKAKTIASVITPENQSVWIEKAETLTKDKLEKDIAIASPQAIKKEKAKIQGPDRIRVEFDLTLEEMALFRRAQDLVSQSLGKSATLAETHNEIVKLFIEKKDPVRKAERASKKSSNLRSEQVKDLVEKTELDNKNRAVQKSEKIEKPRKNDAPLANQPPQDHSKNQTPRKSLTTKVIHALNLRDKATCQAVLPDGSRCGQSRWVHFHHITPVASGGVNSLENLITLCASHHRLWHLQSKPKRIERK